MEDKCKKLDITPEMVVLARNVIKQYTSQVGRFDCHKCFLYENCHKDFLNCPETWEDIRIEENQ